MRRARLAAAAALAAAAGSLAAAAPAAVAQARGAETKPFLDVREAARQGVIRRGDESLRRRAPRRAPRGASDASSLDVDPLTGTPRVLGRLGRAAERPRCRRSGRRGAALRARAPRTCSGSPSPTSPRCSDGARVTARPGRVTVRFRQYARRHPGVRRRRCEVVVGADGSVLARRSAAPQRELALRNHVPRLTAADAMRRLLRRRRRRRRRSASCAGRTGVTRRHDVRERRHGALVAFGDGDGARLAWQRRATGASTAAHYTAVVDATTGEILYRANRDALRPTTAKVWEQYPGAPRRRHGAAPATSTPLPRRRARRPLRARTRTCGRT